jgi:hypothetical protein
MATKKTPATAKPSATSIIAETQKTFGEVFSLEEGARQAHYRAIATLYKGVITLINDCSKEEIATLSKERNIVARSKKGKPAKNAYLQYIKLIFSKREPDKVVATMKDGVEVGMDITYKWTFDGGRYNRYAAYIRWLFEHKVPADQAAATLAEKKLEVITSEDRASHIDPEDVKARDVDRAKQLKAFRGWGTFKPEFRDGAGISHGLNRVIIHMKADGTCQILNVEQPPKDAAKEQKWRAAMVAKVVSEKDEKPEAGNVVQMNEFVPAEYDIMKEIAAQVSASSTFGSMREA